MKSGRKDHKNRLLRPGESQDKEGRYRYSYYENGKQKSFYSWKLEPTDKLPSGKRNAYHWENRLKSYKRSSFCMENILKAVTQF